MPDPTVQTRDPERGADAVIVPSERVAVDLGARTHQGLVREANEDAFMIVRLGRYIERLASSLPDQDVSPRTEDAAYALLLADGMGGCEAGDVASRSALLTGLELALRSPRWALKLDDPRTRPREIQELLERLHGYLAGIHARVREQASSDSRLAGMGTTFTGAYSVGLDLFVLHVGDSKAYVLRNGRLKQVTHDHTVAQHYADVGKIAQEEVATHRMHHVLTRAVGGPSEDLEADTHHVRLESGDRVLLCSDGLTDMVSEAEIAATLALHPGSDAACRALVDQALEHGGRDNVTVVVAGYEVRPPGGA